MTQEDKIKEAKKLYKTANADQRYVLERLFPELKKSDDERIRKYLIGVVNDYCKGNEHDVCIAWLGKQGKQKIDYKVEPKFKIGDKIIKKDFNECNCGTIIDIKDDIYVFDDNSFIYIEEQDDWEVVEQNPWNEDDEHRIKAIIYFLDIAKKHYASTVEIDVCIDWLKSLKSQNRL